MSYYKKICHAMKKK